MTKRKRMVQAGGQTALAGMGRSTRSSLSGIQHDPDKHGPPQNRAQRRAAEKQARREGRRKQ